MYLGDFFVEFLPQSVILEGMIITNQRRKMIVETTSIDWDTDGDKEVFESLPQRVVLTVDDQDDISDALSDMYGRCIFGLAYNIEKQ